MGIECRVDSRPYDAVKPAGFLKAAVQFYCADFYDLKRERGVPCFFSVGTPVPFQVKYDVIHNVRSFVIFFVTVQTAEWLLIFFASSSLPAASALFPCGFQVKLKYKQSHGNDKYSGQRNPYREHVLHGICSGRTAAFGTSVFLILNLSGCRRGFRSRCFSNGRLRHCEKSCLICRERLGKSVVEQACRVGVYLAALGAGGED